MLKSLTRRCQVAFVDVILSHQLRAMQSVGCRAELGVDRSHAGNLAKETGLAQSRGQKARQECKITSSCYWDYNLTVPFKFDG